MIRIDEIYNNVFVPKIQHRPATGLHWFDPFGSVRFEDLVNVPAVAGVAKHRFVFWDQEPIYRDTFSKFIESFQNTYIGPTTLVTSEANSDAVTWAQDTYGIGACYYFFHGWAALDWYRGYDHSFLWPGWMQRDITVRLFCPNNIISGGRQHRVELVSQLAQHGLVDGNLVSFPAQCPYSGQSADALCAELGLPRIPNLPYLIDHAHQHAQNSHRIDFHSQATRAFCHVVTETVYRGRRWHLTEKTFKPIVLQQPFVLLAPQGSLRYLRSYGFRTFDSIWDESYDDLDDDQRLTAVVELLQDINTWDLDRIRYMQHEIAQTVTHNRDWFYGGFQNLLWQELCSMLDKWP